LNSGSNACTTLATSLALTTGFLLEKSKWEEQHVKNTKKKI
jgi:hypothetical protein